MGMRHLSGSSDSELEVSRRILLSGGDSQKGPSVVGGGEGLELSIRTVLGTRTDHSVVFFK